MAIHGDEDQRVQRTLFHVADEQEASKAGLRFDMLVGEEHSLPLRQQARAIADNAVKPAKSSVAGRIEDLPAQSSVGSSNDAEQHLPPRPLPSSQPQILIRIELT